MSRKKKAELKKDIIEVLKAETRYPLDFNKISEGIKRLRVERALKELEAEGKIEKTLEGWRIKRQ